MYSMMREESKFEEDLKPAINLMKIFGMLPQSTAEQTEVSLWKKFRKCFSIRSCTLALRTIIAWLPFFWHAFTLLTRVVRPYYEPEELSPVKHGTKINHLYFHVISVLWSFYCAVTFTVYGPLWIKEGARIQTLWKESSEDNSKEKRANFTRRQRYQILAACVSVTSMLAFLIYYAYSGGIFLISLETSSLITRMAFVLEMVLFFNQYGLWTASMTFLFFICYQLRRKFAAIKIEVNKGRNTLLSLQEKHQKICLVETTDRSIRWHIALTYCIFFFSSCIRVRQVVLTERSSEILTVTSNIIWNWLLLGVLILLSESVSAASVNTAAHDLSFDIYEVYLRDGNYSDCEVFLFVERLNGSHIGFSFLGLFVITRTLVLSLSSLLLTYFVLIVQFSES